MCAVTTLVNPFCTKHSRSISTVSSLLLTTAITASDFGFDTCAHLHVHRPVTGRRTSLVIEAAPQVPRGDRAIRPPGFANLADPIPGRPLAQAVHVLYRSHDPQIVNREHVRTMKPEHQEHFRRPAADAPDL